MQITPRLTTPVATASIACGTLGVCWLLMYGPMPTGTFFLACCTLLVSMLPLWEWVRAGEPTIPMFPLLCLSYGINTGFGAISQPNTIVIRSVRYTLEWEHMNKALWLSLIGVIFMVGAFYLVRTMLRSSRYALRLQIIPDRRTGLLALLVGSALLASVLSSRGLLGEGGHLGILNSFLLIACVLSASFYYRGGARDILTRSVMIILIGHLFLTGIVRGMLEEAFVPLLAILIVRFAWLRRFPVRATLAGFLLFLAFNSTKAEYRGRVWLRNESESFTESLRIWTDVVSKFDPKIFLFGDSGPDPDPLWRKSLARISVIDRIAWVCKNTPERIPYLGGASYRPFLYAPIPRILWPNKPILSEALTDIDATYDLAVINSQGALTAAVGVSYIGEAYANFAFSGVIIIMLIQGVFLAVFDGIYNRVGSEGGAAIYVAGCVYMINGLGSALINIYGLIAQMIICNTLVLLPFARSVVHETLPRRVGLPPPPPGLDGAAPGRTPTNDRTLRGAEQA